MDTDKETTIQNYQSFLYRSVIGVLGGNLINSLLLQTDVSYSSKSN
ncbi:MAG TPA: hypothetical protein PK079_12955 [Leptospiraceae bacterium]|nr:hypothetical protein [Leptospiraceae bacterium]HMX32996.1 hypothetical protein [Leptospiraceae bacterium]HMY33255.1 hypothetical protein [Leptospiraceae bacterium]HMZ66584.1 hypothetical protein [Leptospiraceae bacterium]HNC57897.1 hypothetical protein [Leptospiraceae bacterium]